MWRTMPDTSAQTAAKLRIAAFGSIAVAMVVLGLKLLAYWRTGSVALYSDALGPPDSPGGTYPGMIRHNVKAIVEALTK